MANTHSPLTSIFSGIKFRLFLLGAGPAFFLALILDFYFLHNRAHDLEQSLRDRGFALVHQLATASAYGLANGNSAYLQNLANQLLLEKQVASVKIYDIHGKALAIAQRIPQPLRVNQLNFETPIFDDGMLHNSSHDSLTIDFPADPATNKIIGHAQLKLSLAAILNIKQTVLVNSLIITFAGLLITPLLVYRLGSSMVEPLIKLTETVNALATGNMDARADFAAFAEIETLRQSFNAMAIGLKKNKSYLEQQIDNATNQLRVTLKSLKEKILSLEQTKELAVAQNDIKSQFLAHISHEIRTPMNSILGFTDLLSKTSLTIQQAEHVQLVKNSASNLLIIVNDILDYSSLESGKFKINIKPYDLYQSLEETVTLLSAQSENIPVVLDIPAYFPKQLATDPIRLQQIVTNLLGNAIKFTRRGHIILRCRLLDPTSLLISISDTGPGIPKQHHHQLFSPFLQLSEYAINTEIGTGLGLTISKNIIEGLNGSIGLLTRENIGSTFWFNLPITIVQPLQRIEPRQRACIIDYFSVRRNAFCKQLTRIGYHTCGLNSASELFDMKSRPIDILFLAPPVQKDNQFNLSSLLNRIKAKFRIPIVLLTAKNLNTEQFYREHCLALPAGSLFLTHFIASILKNNSFRKPPEIAPQPSQKYAILVADDNEINRLLLKSQLENRCKKLTLACNGKETVELLHSERYDLMLLDLQMPGMSGIDIIRLIKNSDCINAQTPSVAITAHAREEQRQDIIDAGFDECLIKPVLADQLNEIIDLWLPTEASEAPQEAFTSSQYIDFLQEKTQYNKDLTKTLFIKLFKELPEQINKIDAAISQNELYKAKEITHNLHGSVSFCGLTDLQQAAKCLELLLIEDNLPKIALHFHNLEISVQHFMAQKQKILSAINQ